MKEFKISELGAVDLPAQEPAVAVLLKRAGDVEKKYKTTAELPASVRDALPAAAQRQFLAVVNSALDGGASDTSAFSQAWGALKNAGWHKNDEGKWVKKNYGEAAPCSPTVVAQEVQALDFDDVLAEDEAREASYRVKDEVWRHWNALQRSFDTIAADEDVAAADKVTSMRQSLNQFLASLGEEARADITKRLTAVPAIAALLKDEEGDEAMNAAVKKQLDELQKSVKALTDKVAGATDADKPDLAKQLAAVKKQLDDLVDKSTQDDAERAELVIKAGMSDDEKAYMDKMSAEDRKSFMEMTADDRKKKMKKAVDSDPVVYKSESTGEEFRKSDDPRLVKMAKQADASEALAKDERDKRETAEITKRADELLKSYAGDTAVKVDVMRAISKMGDAPRQALEKMLETGAKAIAAAFEKIGHSREEISKTGRDFEKRVDEIVARDKISKSVAMSRARVEYPDEFRAYQAAAN